MTRHIERAAVLAAALLCWRAEAGAAQARPTADSSAGDSLVSCAQREAVAAGFHPIPVQRAGRVGLMRPMDTPGPRYPLDALSLRATADSTGTLRLEVRVTTFMVSRTSLSQEEVTPRPSLVALADSLRARCRRPASPVVTSPRD